MVIRRESVERSGPASCSLLALDEAFQIFQKLDVFLVLQRSAQLHELLSESVIHPSLGQEVHQVVIQGLQRHSLLLIFFCLRSK